ncbi:hypothetical protein [Polymorphospora sp. NPDC050346]|uniref:hypothetical protein n=1 Tax=Polymorphospora sp. NPDC050346 TaxID=3155780 RepID=UPI0033DFE351
MTTSTSYGGKYGDATQRDGILEYVAGDSTLTGHERNVLADRLFTVLRAELDALLPEGVTWQPDTAEFVHPVDATLPAGDEMDDLFAQAWQAVEARYEVVEREMFGDLPATVEDLEAALKAIGDPIRRARVATLLVDAGMRQMAGLVRAEAVHAARGQGLSRPEIAEQLNTGVAAVSKLASEHRARLREMTPDRARLEHAKERVDALIDDPFGGQILRDLVPRGHKITTALGEERAEDAIRRCMSDSALPTVMAVDEQGQQELTLLLVDQPEPGKVTLTRPGDWRPVAVAVADDAAATLSELIEAMRAAHRDPEAD